MRSSDLFRNRVKTIDGAGSGLDSDLVRGKYVTPYTFKNKIINGDMQVVQRGRMHSLTDDGDYTADRWYSEIQNGSEEVRQEIVYSPTAGSWKDETDPFGDGSQHNLWTLDGTADDLNGNNNGTLNGDATFIDDVLPNIGSCKVLSLDGDGDYVDPDISGTSETILSLCCWMKIEDESTGDASGFGFIRDAHSNENSAFMITPKISNVFQWGVWRNGGQYDILTGIKPRINVWTFVTVTYDRNKSVFYIDGKKIAENNNSGLDLNDSPFYIGKGLNYFKGQISRARVFLDKALNDDEVRKLYIEDSKYIFKNHLKSIITQDNDISTYTPFVYRFEGQDIAPYIAKQEKMVLSFDFASSNNRDFTLKLNYPDGSEFKSYTFNYNGDKEFQKISQVIDFSDFDLTKLIVDENLGLELQIVNDTDVDVADWVSVTDVQLEVGDIATEFERISYDNQLNRCLRYYEELNEGETILTQGQETDRNFISFKFYNKRNIPTVNNIYCKIDTGDYDGIEFYGYAITNKYVRYKNTDSLDNTHPGDNVYDITTIKIDAEL